MYYNNRGNQQFYGTGCSLFGCAFTLLIVSFVVRGSLYLFFRYFWVILLLGIIIWGFQKITRNNTTNTETQDSNNKTQNQTWQRDYENQKNTSYHNIDRQFEEVDEEDEKDRDKEFEDF